MLQLLLLLQTLPPLYKANSDRIESHGDIYIGREIPATAPPETWSCEKQLGQRQLPIRITIFAGKATMIYPDPPDGRGVTETWPIRTNTPVGLIADSISNHVYQGRSVTSGQILSLNRITGSASLSNFGYNQHAYADGRCMMADNAPVE
jgi:hypothetical protein